MPEVSRLFWRASQSNHVAEMRYLLLSNPSLDINWKNPFGRDFTPLQTACKNAHPEAVEFLLSFPEIHLQDLQLHYDGGEDRPDDELLLACRVEAPEVVRILLKDPRLPLPNINAILHAVEFNRLDSLRWILLAFPHRDNGLLDPRVEERARVGGKGEVLRLIGEFKGNRADCLHQIRLHFCRYFVDELAADLFSHVVFVSDALLVVKEENGDGGEKERRARRFFSVAAKLPIELQMGLCYRAFGSRKEIVLSCHSEVAFRQLAAQVRDDFVVKYF